MRRSPDKLGTIHLIGIGGIGMSGIAEILKSQGYAVQGSDQSDSANVKRLRDQGITVHIGHAADNLIDRNGKEVCVVVRSTAVKMDNPEVVSARRRGIAVIKRAEMLGEVMALKQGIAISGTHGKTTTTSLVGTVLQKGGIDPTVINGGIVHAYGSNTRLGDGEWMVVEADESDGSFLHLPATAVVVTNIDPEHLDHYGDYDAIKDAFRQFVQNIPFYGFAVLCIDHPAVQALMTDIHDRRMITYGFSRQADIRGKRVNSHAVGQEFSVSLSPSLANRLGIDVEPGLFTLPMLGDHNLSNALSAIACGLELGIDIDDIRSALASFTGVSRRFTKTGEVNGVTVIDDYAHHPVEISAVLAAARSGLEGSEGRLIAVVQPHRYTRLQSLFQDFCTCFNDADQVIVADVYAAGEEPIKGASKQDLVAGLIAAGVSETCALEDPSDLPAMIHAAARPGDMVIFLGAGNITGWAHALPSQIEALIKECAA